MRQIRKVNYRKQLKEKYSLGGILNVVKEVSPLINLVAPGVGTAIGAAAGAGAGVANGVQSNHDQLAQQKQLQMQQQLQANQPNPNMMYPPRQYPGGGTTPVDTLGFAARSDSAMNANKNLNFVQRANNPTMSLGNKTHFMSWGTDDQGNFIYPNVVQKKGENHLTELHGKDSQNYAKKTGEYIRTGKDDDFSEYLSTVGYKKNFPKKDYDEAMKNYSKEINSTRGFKKYQKGGVKSDGPADQTKDQMLNYKNDDALNGYNNARKLLTDYHLNNPQLYKKIQELDTENQGSMAPIVQRMTDMINHYNSKGMVNDSTRLYERMMNENLSARGSSPMFMSRGNYGSSPYNTTTGKTIFPGYTFPITSNAEPEHFATGGSIHKVQQPQDGNAELEDGEVFKTPQGKMDKVTGNTHAEGGEQYNLPQGTQILGKNKAPNGKMYKEEGEKLMKDYTKYSKILASKPTPIAKKTAKMMLDKIEQKYSQLMQQQEAEKGHLQGQGSTIPLQPEHYTKEELSSNQGRISDYNGADIQSPRDNRGFAQGGTIRNPQYDEGDLITSPSKKFTPFASPNIDPAANVQKAVEGDTMMYGNSGNPKPAGFNWNNALNVAQGVGNLAPVAYNLGEGLFGKPQHINPSQFYNPYEGAALGAMKDRRYDVEPELEANKVATADYYKNLRQSGASAGQYVGGLQAGQISKQRADSAVYSKANNMNNEYSAQYAGMLENAGQQRANTNYQTEMLNQENIAAQKRYIPTALSQLSQASQVGQQMRNEQSAQDKQNQSALDIYKMKYKNYGFLLQDPEFLELAKSYIKQHK